ncbi:RNA polymerase sigma factor [Actinacidiphila oryziradicis]|uniref:RNA polymerase sigma factor n=1 Tax=Actinacidiphila oryziradicis TaxID=2571141 RepID=A0A4U0RNK4_9ACTN|nr:RNA polymerase sigma factor [Actinacidiphila oryziradicis]TJZ96752.1 RNA polymerase sigma factor [Actinacidiphila oryziradicis]
MSTHDPAEGADRLARPASALPASIDHRAAERAATDRASFSAFYRETIKPLVAYLIVSGTPAPIAAEIAQECMIELFRRWGSVSHPRAYVYKAAGRMWGRRVAKVRMEVPVEELPEPTSLVPKPDALTEFEARHDSLQILKALPPRQGQVLALDCDGFTSAEIAQQLELEPATVRAHRLRARRAAARIKEGEEEQ